MEVANKHFPVRESFAHGHFHMFIIIILIKNQISEVPTLNYNLIADGTSSSTRSSVLTSCPSCLALPRRAINASLIS